MSQFIKESYERLLIDEDIPGELYNKYQVKRGLRNEDGTGVLVGLTRISDVVGYKRTEEGVEPCEGHLYYRGIDVADIVKHAKGRRFVFETVCFLILFGHLPNRDELDSFKQVLANRYELPEHFLERSILNYPATNLMNRLQQEVLILYNYDKFNPDSIDPYDTLEKGINLIAKIPVIVCYTYATKIHAFENKSLIIHQIDPNLSIAEQILHLLKPDGRFTPKEAEVLDTALVLHADHGGGNNSTFTNVVISSTGTDLFSTIAGSIGSLKGPRHGGANLAVRKQMKAVIKRIGLDATDDEIREIVNKILDKQFNDRSGLVYGIGHAVYTLSDPRSVLLAQKCEEISIEKDRHDEFLFHKRFGEIAVEEIYKRKGKPVCTNVDFYSGLVYDMLGIPEDLYTLLFVIGRTVGWIAHNVEEKLYGGRIIRPATKYVGVIQDYKDTKERE